MKKLMALFLQLSLTLKSFSQSTADTITFPTVGQPCPDFLLKDVTYYPQKQVMLSDFKGKWLVLDLWSSRCAGCVKSFPKVNGLAHEFKNKAQFLLVGYDDQLIRPLFERFRRKEDLDLPCAFDTSLFTRFDVGAVPFVVIIDDKGIVRGVTASLNSGILNDLLAGKTPLVEDVERHHPPETSFNPYGLFMVNGNGANDSLFKFRSLLTDCTPEMPMVYLNSNLRSCVAVFKKRGFQILGANLGTLYRFAYLGNDGVGFRNPQYGNVYFGPVLEIKDSSDFKYDMQTRKGLYCYSLAFPESKSDTASVMGMIQRDLQTYFRYAASIETRKMPYWRLVVTHKARSRLRSKSDSLSVKGLPHIDFVARDIPVSSVLGKIATEHLDEIFIDGTGITGKIDIDLSDCLFFDLDDVKRALRLNDLDLVRRKKKMKVLVIRDNRQAQ